MPARKGEPSWNAGTGKGWTDKKGYRWIYVTENGKRRAKREHRHIMEQHLKRKLHPEELVHHINGVKDDNRVENLSIEDWAEHTVNHCAGSKRDEYTKKRMQVLASYREDHKRLNEINSELLEALEDVEKKLTRALSEKYAGRHHAVQKVRRVIAKAKGEI